MHDLVSLPFLFDRTCETVFYCCHIPAKAQVSAVFLGFHFPAPRIEHHIKDASFLRCGLHKSLPLTLYCKHLPSFSSLISCEINCIILCVYSMFQLAVTGYEAVKWKTIYYQTLQYGSEWHLIPLVCDLFWPLNFCWCLHQLGDRCTLFMHHLVAQPGTMTIDFQRSAILVSTANKNIWDICNKMRKEREHCVLGVVPRLSPVLQSL